MLSTPVAPPSLLGWLQRVDLELAAAELASEVLPAHPAGAGPRQFAVWARKLSSQVARWQDRAALECAGAWNGLR